MNDELDPWIKVMHQEGWTYEKRDDYGLDLTYPVWRRNRMGYEETIGPSAGWLLARTYCADLGIEPTR